MRALSRFQTKKEQDETLIGLKDGKVDVVVGTHRLLSKDVHFKNLGLLVVDEEQRFGVAHKERIKQLRAQVDVLTLTATPIPRTLQMAVTGLRDLSLITTPPVDRRAVRTIVTRWDDQVVREAVTRELARGGQVLLRLQPGRRALREGAAPAGARARRAHRRRARPDGRGVRSRRRCSTSSTAATTCSCRPRSSRAASTSRAPTRWSSTAPTSSASRSSTSSAGASAASKERAYCYLVVPPANAMTDEARSRIEALERHTELGSGFQIASLDLELRGAGDLLGAEQSGSVASVGFDLFCQMLDEAVHELRGEEVVHDVDTELSFDVEALLPEDYVADVGVRLSLYKRLASAIDEGHVTEIAGRDGGPLRRAAGRGAAPRQAHAPQDRAAPAARARLRGQRASS